MEVPMTREDQIQVCKLVAQAIFIDGQLTDNEMQMFDRLLTHFEITPAEKKIIVARNLDDDVRAMAQAIQGEDGKTEALVQLAQAITADGHTTGSERDILHRCADAMGIPPDRLKEIVAPHIQLD
ncbi:MAG: hypothetical protein CVU59_05650 [Deltaproteobacteria bacterium HGW-Deltaproteobacteria-17]|nr:MAG: hypothetical protein CVU59_05650 [Deltaproteobacteria bacterium HGW-Deltaproteobacteria-17]